MVLKDIPTKLHDRDSAHDGSGNYESAEDQAWYDTERGLHRIIKSFLEVALNPEGQKL